MRLDAALYQQKITQSRSQAENYIKLGLVTIDGLKAKKASQQVSGRETLKIIGDQYVSRAALKLASIADQFSLDFADKTVLDVGSSTGGFTDYALQHGAKKVIAVDVGTEQLHPSLRSDDRVELHEKTDIRNFSTNPVDTIVADVSFISLTKILPSLKLFAHKETVLIMMCKPQFEAEKDQINKGVVKNSAVRRSILKGFEQWLQKNNFIILDKADSQVAGTKGNVERFYKIKLAV